MTNLIKDDAKVISVYGNSEFCLVKSNNTLFLLKGSYIFDENIVVVINNYEELSILDMNSLMIFVDKFNKEKITFEESEIDRIKKYLFIILEKYLADFIKFENTEFTGNFERIFNRFPEDLKLKIINGLEKIHVYSNGKFTESWSQLYSVSQMEYAIKTLRPFIKLNADRLHYDICRMPAENKWKVYAKNGSAGTLEKIAKDKENCCYIVFNSYGDTNIKRTKEKKNTLNIEAHQSQVIKERIDEDLKIGSGYAAANKFVKLEEKFIKSIEEYTEAVANKQLFIDLEKIYYPNIDNNTEQISILIRKYAKLKNKGLDENAKELIEIKENLIREYTLTFDELRKAQNSLKVLQQLA